MCEGESRVLFRSFSRMRHFLLALLLSLWAARAGAALPPSVVIFLVDDLGETLSDLLWFNPL